MRPASFDRYIPLQSLHLRADSARAAGSMQSPSQYVDIDFLLEKGNFMDAGSLNSSVSLEWRVEGMAICVYMCVSLHTPRKHVSVSVWLV